MDKLSSFIGGEFLVTDAAPHEIFTPEDFTKDHILIAQSADEFHRKELMPNKEEIEAYNPELLKKYLKILGELGFLGADIPEIFGGTELDKVGSTLISEKISSGVSGFNVSFMVQTGIGSIPIVMFGSTAQKKKYLPGLASGELIGAYALTESEHGSDALSAEASAVLTDDGKYYILNGQKQFISNAGFADLFVTYAQINDDKFTSFIVERKWEGVSVDEEEKKMGMHGCSTRAVIFKDVKVPVENVLGEIGRGHVVALNTLNIGRYKLGATTLGSAKLMLSEALNYSKSRVQFDKPICEFGLIKQKLAEITIKTYVNECMVYRIAGLLNMALEVIDLTEEDAGLKTGAAIREYAVECSINKVYGSEVLDYITDECVQIMGGYGYIKDYPAEGAYRDSRINRIWEGTNEINRLVIVDMLMKSAMKGKLPLLKAIGDVNNEFADLRYERKNNEKILEKELNMVKMAKKIVLFAAGAAAGKYMTRLSEEQEIVANISDMIIEIFAMESCLLRTLKTVERSGETETETQSAITSVYINNVFPEIIILFQEIMAAIYTGDELEGKLTVLKRINDYTPINTISLKRKIADSVIKSGRYHLTKY
jgi:alkylation response protein AidB-like acyl-CoA dehydrogenase